MRETTCFNKTAVEVSKEAGCRWQRMTDCEKAPYIVQAYKVSRNVGDDTKKRGHSDCSIGEPKSKVKRSN